MIKISVKSDFARLQRGLGDLARKQIPFAAAQAVTGIARQVAAAEVESFRQKLASPTPFTLRGVGVTPARKARPIAIVYLKDIQATYLAPLIEGGAQVLGKKRAILTPRDIGLNAYGNLPKSVIAALKSRGDVFVGEVRTRSGEVIGGVWQRPTRAGAVNSGRRVRGLRANTSGRLKLLVQFTRPAQVTHRLPWEKIAKLRIARAAGEEWAKALGAALR